MKHLISLSFKYIRRQKLRTFLTFMCIMLSAFILATVCVYGSSLYTTLYNYTATEDGLWELEISSWIDDKDDLEVAKHHAVVSDYYYTSWGNAFFSSESLKETHRFGRFEISDGKHCYLAHGVTASKEEGNKALEGIHEGMYSINIDTSAEGVMVPEFIRKMGYSAGDTITLTIRPFTAVFDEDSDIVKEIRADLKEKNGTELTPMDEGFEELPKEVKKKARQTSISNELYSRNIDYQDFPLADIQYSGEKEVTFKIAGFIPEQLYFDSFTVMNGENSDISIYDLIADDPNVNINSDSCDLKIRLIDNFDYDKALEMLFTDLGHNYNTEFYDSYKFGYNTNELLLALEVKSAYALYKVLASVIVPGLLVLLIAWFISRFVIDNTFEMAVKERSTHFAALRIIGASNTQVAAIVFIEAVFYCFTAVPLGIISAILLCKGSFTALRSSGLELFEFSAKPAFIVVSAFLTVLAIFISAYTSAMWAARKLSPAEALNFGKPRSKNRKFRKRKSKLTLSAGKFIRRYTKKNIKAAKSRFVISTITMALGVLMFTVTSLILSFVYTEYKKETSQYKIRDFYIDDYISYSAGNPAEELDKYFGDKELFSEFLIRGYDSFYLSQADGSDRLAADKLSIAKTDSLQNCSIYAVDESTYKEIGIDKITGMSYQEFAGKNGALFNNCIYGMEVERDDSGKFIQIYPESYTDLKKGYTLTSKKGDSIHITGKISSEWDDCSIIIPLENSDDYDMNYYIELTVNGREHYDEALSRFNEFRQNENCQLAANRYTTGTGLRTFISAIVKIVLIFLVSIWLVGILSMINSVNTSVLNRSRELMMLRSVGMTRKQLRKSILLETIMFSATAAVAGTLVGIAGFVLFTNAAGMKTSSLIKYIIPVAAVSLTLNVIIALISALPATRSLGRVESIAQASNE